MSINAITSVSLYEYYYQINKDDKKKKSPLADEMEKYGLTPVEDEAMNAFMLNRARQIEAQSNQEEKQTQNYSSRPWADLMYQLNLSFNENPADDIQAIKDELDELINQIDDDDLKQEIDELKDQAEEYYVDYTNIHSGGFDNSFSLNMQMNNLAMLNRSLL